MMRPTSQEQTNSPREMPHNVASSLQQTLSGKGENTPSGDISEKPSFLVGSSKAAQNVDLLECNKLNAGPPPDIATTKTETGKCGNDDDEDDDGDEKKLDTRKRAARQRIPRAKKPKDMPRRPLSAYNIFFKSTRAKMMESINQEASGGKSIYTEKIGFETLAKTIGREWKALSAKELEEYKAMADKDMQRYKREMEDYHQNLAKKRRVTLPAAPTPEGDDETGASTYDSAKGRRSDGMMVDSPSHPFVASSLSSLIGSEDALCAAQHESAFTSSGDTDYGSFVEALAAARSQQQTDQQALLQEYANIRRQELFLRHAAAADPLTGILSQHATSTGAGSLLYEHLLAQKLELLRSQQAMASGIGLSQSQYSHLSGLQSQHQSHAPSLLEQLLLLQQNRRASGLAALQGGDSSAFGNIQSAADALDALEAQQRYADPRNGR